MSDDAPSALRFRDVLPAAGTPHRFFGFGPNGEVYALAWSVEAEAFQAVGFGPNGRPTAILVREPGEIVARILELPIDLLPREGQGEAPQLAEGPADKPGLNADEVTADGGGTTARTAGKAAAARTVGGPDRPALQPPAATDRR